MFKKSLKYMLVFLFLLFPSSVLANDLEITCFSEDPPNIVRNTDPLFQISGFLPGDSTSRTIYVENTSNDYDCRVFFDISGEGNILTNKIEVKIPGLFDGTLSEYIDSNVKMADLGPNGNITRTITMSLPPEAGNTYARKQASFDIFVNSEWGEDGENNNESENDGENNNEEGGAIQGAIAGVTDFLTAPITFLGGVIGGGIQDVAEGEFEEEDENMEEVLGDRTEEENDTGEILGARVEKECSEKTLWWIPLVAQLLLTLIIIFVNKSFLKAKGIKLLISIFLGIISYLLIRWIGCSCDPAWICLYHWIPNTIIALSPALTYLKKEKGFST